MSSSAALWRCVVAHAPWSASSTARAWTALSMPSSMATTNGTSGGTGPSAFLHKQLDITCPIPRLDRDFSGWQHRGTANRPSSRRSILADEALCVPKWRNWQTRYIQGVVPVRVWRFESSLRHQILLFLFSPYLQLV